MFFLILSKVLCIIDLFLIYFKIKYSILFKNIYILHLFKYLI